MKDYLPYIIWPFVAGCGIGTALALIARGIQ